MGGALKVFSLGRRSRRNTVSAEQEQAERLAYSEAWRHRTKEEADAVPPVPKAVQNAIDVGLEGGSKSQTGASKASPPSDAATKQPAKQETASSKETTTPPKETLADIKAAVDAALAQNRASFDRPRTPNRVHPAAKKRQEEEPRGRTPKADYVPYVLRTDEPQQVLQEIDAVYRTPRWFREQSRPGSLADSTYDDTQDFPVDSARVSPHFGKDGELLPISRQPSVDFSLIDRHRQTLAAETGQLTSRATKQLTINVDLASGRRPQSSPRTHSSYETRPPPSPRAPYASEIRSQSASRASSRKPRPESLASAISAAESFPMLSPGLPGVTSFADFVQSTPPSPTLTFSPTFSPGEQEDISHMLEYAFPSPRQSEPVSPLVRAPGHDLERRSTAERTSAGSMEQPAIRIPERAPGHGLQRRANVERTSANSMEHTTLSPPERAPGHGLERRAPSERTSGYSTEQSIVSDRESLALSARLSSPASVFEPWSNSAPIESPSPVEIEAASPQQESFEKIRARRETVIRGRGSGFEILEPGTLPEIRPEAYRLKSAPPVSIQNFSRPRQRSMSRGRKLQKRQSSIDTSDSSRDSSNNRRRFSVIQLWSRRNSVQD